METSHLPQYLLDIQRRGLITTSLNSISALIRDRHPHLMKEGIHVAVIYPSLQARTNATHTAYNSSVQLYILRHSQTMLRDHVPSSPIGSSPATSHPAFSLSLMYTSNNPLDTPFSQLNNVPNTSNVNTETVFSRAGACWYVSMLDISTVDLCKIAMLLNVNTEGDGQFTAQIRQKGVVPLQIE